MPKFINILFQLVKGHLIQGFDFIDEKIVLITEYDILQKK